MQKNQSVKFSNPVWTEGDKYFLRKHYATMPMEDMIKRLGRTARAIHTKASALRITGARWGVDHNRTGRPEKKTTIMATGRKSGSKQAKPETRNTRNYATIQFTTEGKRRIQVDAKTYIYVSASATQKEIENILLRYAKRKK